MLWNWRHYLWYIAGGLLSAPVINICNKRVNHVHRLCDISWIFKQSTLLSDIVSGNVINLLPYSNKGYGNWPSHSCKLTDNYRKSPLYNTNFQTIISRSPTLKQTLCCPINPKGHSITHPWVSGKECFLWTFSLIYLLHCPWSSCTNFILW